MIEEKKKVEETKCDGFQRCGNNEKEKPPGLITTITTTTTEELELASQARG